MSQMISAYFAYTDIINVTKNTRLSVHFYTACDGKLQQRPENEATNIHCQALFDISIA